MRVHKLRSSGFTLVELTLAIALMSFLLMAVLYTTIQCGKMYEKGITYKNVNQVSRELVDLMRRDFASADASDIKFVIETGTPMANQTGRICTGRITYVWNTAALLNDSNVSAAKIMLGSKPATFARVTDILGKYCIKTGATYPMTLPADGAQELLGSSGRELSVYSLRAALFAGAAGTFARNGLFEVAVQIGTNDVNATVIDTATGQYICRPPSDNAANFDYCAVVDVNTILRTGGAQ